MWNSPIISFYLLVCLGISVCSDILLQNNNFNKDKIIARELTTWNSILNWNECNDDSLWNWLNSRCVPVNSNPIAYRQDFTYNHRNCVNSVESGWIDLIGQPDHNISIGFESGSSNGARCQWEFDTNERYVTKIVVNRNIANYEDLSVDLYTSTSDSALYDNKNLSAWSSTTHIIEMEGVGFVRIRAKLYSTADSGSFNATISQYEKEESDDILLEILLLIGLVLAFSCTTWACICVITVHLRIKYQNNRQRQRQLLFAQRLIEDSFVRVDDTMKKMNNGKFSSFQTRYSQDSCVICLEEYEPDSCIHVTNECSHVFHTSCLKEWYDSIEIDKDLVCPHCNTVNTKDSFPSKESHTQDIGTNAYEDCEEVKNNSIEVIMSNIEAN